MSFFKHFPPDYDEPPDRQQTPKRDRPVAQLGSTGERGPRITLNRVREALRDPGEEYDSYKPETEECTTGAFRKPSLDITPDASTVEDILQMTREYLEAEATEEYSRVDRTSEFKFEKVVLHPKGNELPPFSLAEELRNVSDPDDLRVPVKRMGMTVDRPMMKHISAGLGPRPFQSEDLIEKLRSNPRPQSEFDEAPHVEESYAEILAVLRAWNMRVGATSNLTRERKELLDALEARCLLIHGTEIGNQNEFLLEEQCVRLRQILHAFRPELKDFENQDVFDQLIILVANHGIANPDLGDEVKDLVIKTLFREYRWRIYRGGEHSARRVRLDAETQRAKLREDSIEEEELTKQRRKLDKKSVNQASAEVRTAIRSAQQRLYKKVLEDLQRLAQQQAGQKWAACGITKAPASMLAQSCIDNESDVDEMVRDWDLNFDDVLKAASRSMQQMSRLDTDNCRQAKKLAGRDVPTAERRVVMERRRKDYRTPLIMEEVQDQSSQVQDLSRRVIGRMDELNFSLAYALETASASYRAHDTLLARIDEDDPYCMKPAPYVVEEPPGGEEVKAEVEGATEEKESARAADEDVWG